MIQHFPWWLSDSGFQWIMPALRTVHRPVSDVFGAEYQWRTLNYALSIPVNHRVVLAEGTSGDHKKNVTELSYIRVLPQRRTQCIAYLHAVYDPYTWTRPVVKYLLPFIEISAQDCRSLTTSAALTQHSRTQEADTLNKNNLKSARISWPPVAVASKLSRAWSDDGV